MAKVIHPSSVFFATLTVGLYFRAYFQLALPPSLRTPQILFLSSLRPNLGAGYTVEIGPLSAALSASIYRICELIKSADRWRIMKKI